MIFQINIQLIKRLMIS